MKIRRGMVCVWLIVAMTGCGGGGGGSDEVATVNKATAPPPVDTPTDPLPVVKPSTDPTSPAGIWHGTGLDDRTLTALVLGSGEYLAIYSATGNASVTGGLVQGTGTLSGNTFYSQDAIDLNFEGAGSNPADLMATIEFQISLNGSLAADAAPSSKKEFTFTFSPLSNQAPSLARVAGVYNGELAGLVGTEHYAVTIDEAGAITATAISGCLATGTVRPQVLTNIYDVEIAFGSEPCFRPGKVVSGVGTYDPNTNLLLIGLVDSSRNRGFVFSGNREGGADFDGDRMADVEDTDDDNDGALDTHDQCPLDANPGCPDTVLADAKEWLQPRLFSALTWNEIDTVCPTSNAGACNGMLAGRDMSGWTWASAIELRALFDFYQFTIPPPGWEWEESMGIISRVVDQESAAKWLASAWRPTRTACDSLHCYYFYSAYTRKSSDLVDDPEHKRSIATLLLSDYPNRDRTSQLEFYGFLLADLEDGRAPGYGEERQGAWFHRSQSIH